MNLIGIVLRLHAWHSNTDNERQVVSDYRDYQKIDDFYTAVRSRNCYLLQNQVSRDILNILNKDCVNKAALTYTGIDWRKFHKLDPILLIPAIILGSLFIALVPLILTSNIRSNIPGIMVGMAILVTVRGISSYFIIRLTLRAIQGVIVNNYGFPSIFRSFAFTFFCFLIVGIPWLIAPLVVEIRILQVAPPIAMTEAAIITYYIASDIGSMLLLTSVVWWWYMKHKLTSRRHFLFKKQRAS
jgi:hypothetical protein